DVETSAIEDASGKLGWVSQGGGGGRVGQYEAYRIDVKKGKDTGQIQIIRPTAKPLGGTSNMVPPKEQKGTFDADKAATFYDEAAEVLVAVKIEGKPAEAKKLLDKLVKKGK